MRLYGRQRKFEKDDKLLDVEARVFSSDGEDGKKLLEEILSLRKRLDLMLDISSWLSCRLSEQKRNCTYECEHGLGSFGDDCECGAKRRNANINEALEEYNEVVKHV